ASIYTAILSISVTLLSTDSLYRKRLSIDGRQLNLEIFDPCSQRGDSPHVPEEPLEWADAFVVVYAVSDHVTFLNAKHLKDTTQLKDTALLKDMAQLKYMTQLKDTAPHKDMTQLKDMAQLKYMTAQRHIPPAALFVFDLYSETNVPVCLLGNKQDLCHSRQVSEEEGRSLSLEHRCLFQEVSAAENYLDIARLIRHVMEQMKRRSDRQRYSGKRRKSV
ncbi:hypothetical protein P4O66_006657, partial [Electrophorus voltai]